MGQCYRDNDSYIPNLVWVGLPNTASLEKTIQKLKSNQIPFFKWEEPDFDYGLTAVATIPLTQEQKQVLVNYKLLKHSPIVQVERSTSKVENVSSILTG